MSMKGTMRRAVLGGLILLLAAPPSALAQLPPPALPPPAGAPAPPTFRQEELDQLLAPIALYPDALLAQILMASTYPLEVVQAARWVRAYPNVKGAQLEAAMQQQPWDPSVKSLTAFPQVLSMMDEHLGWTQKLGDAFLAQQQDVMATVQTLRAKAQAAGYLQSTSQQTVIVEPQVIRIEPATPQIVYVPIYNPILVYGPWWYPAYPPYYWYPPGYVVGTSVFSFVIGVPVGAALWGGFDWRHRTVSIVNVNHFNSFNRTRITNVVPWRHDADHRRGVPYHDPRLRRRFDQGPRAGVAAREAFRGRAQEAPQHPSRGGVERRPGSGSSPSVIGAPQGGFGPRQPLEPPRQPERQQRPGGGSGPPVSSPAQEAPQQPRQGGFDRRPGGGSGPRVGGGAPQGGFGPRQPLEAPRQPAALEGLGRGGEIRSSSDRGRVSRGSTGAAEARPVPGARPGAGRPDPSGPRPTDRDGRTGGRPGERK